MSILKRTRALSLVTATLKPGRYFHSAHILLQHEKTGGGYIPPRLDYTYIYENIQHINKNMQQRQHITTDTEAFQRNYEKRKKLYVHLVSLREQQNTLSKEIKEMSKDSVAERHSLISQSRVIKTDLVHVQEQLEDIESQMLSQALQLPNTTHPRTPVGPESEARVLKTIGSPRIATPETPLQDHMALAHRLSILDLKQAAIVSGSSFYYLQGMGAFLETALIQYAMHKAAGRGFLAVTTPDIVKTSIAYGCGYQPRNNKSSQIYHLSGPEPTHGNALCLSGTAEIPLAGKFAMRLIEQADLPQRLVGLGRAFRVEAGGRGTETKGLYRVHQFSKVELFAVTTFEQSDAMMEEFRELQEEMFTELGLCFRVLDMPTEELGASAYRKYDMEAWMPGRNAWGEISSTSNCTDYQSRRLSIRYRPTHLTEKNTFFCHTVNGTALAVPRIIIAILETFQNTDGTVEIPSVLRKWMPGEPSFLS
ncbi:hypothetical protein BDF14DRAFT_1013230 [Spinellus fusiger]|nr:hypothetical protein BDF14DRAFT_1013230 [Spinellus fusiger]